MSEQKEIFTVSIDEIGNITEKKYVVFLGVEGEEIARSKPTTQTISPGDPTRRRKLLQDSTKLIVDVVHTPEVVAAYRELVKEAKGGLHS